MTAPKTNVFIASVFLIMTVQMLAAIRTMRAPMMEKLVDAKNVSVCFATPL